MQLKYGNPCDVLYLVLMLIGLMLAIRCSDQFTGAHSFRSHHHLQSLVVLDHHKLGQPCTS